MFLTFASAVGAFTVDQVPESFSFAVSLSCACRTLCDFLGFWLVGRELCGRLTRRARGGLKETSFDRGIIYRTFETLLQVSCYLFVEEQNVMVIIPQWFLCILLVYFVFTSAILDSQIGL